MKNHTNQDTSNTDAPTTLDEMLAKTCFCKLREFCDDKNSSECLRNKNIYDEFMQQKRPHAK